MHVIVVYGWKEETTDFVQAISRALGITVFEVQQRMIGGSPIVVASFADPQQAQILVTKLNEIGIGTLVVDAAEVRGRTGDIIVRRFELNASSLRIETSDRQHADIPYDKIDLLLPCTSIARHSETKTVTERKFSLGKTLMTGIPMSKKVKRQKDASTEQSRKSLYLYVGKRRQPIVFSRDGLAYDGLGTVMKISRELNFTYLMSELHRLSPEAVYDDRLLKRFGQVRLLGPTLNPETNLDLAVEILARSLRSSQKRNNTVVS